MEIGYEAQPITHYVCENFNTVGWQYVANIKAIVGGTTGKPSVGVVLRLGIIKPQLAKKRR
jgi:hypothetical protein